MRTLPVSQTLKNQALHQLSCNLHQLFHVSLGITLQGKYYNVLFFNEKVEVEGD